MSFDIYGEHLQRGHCEVHPWVHDEYPCSICMSKNREKKLLEQEYLRACEAQANEYYAQQFANEEYLSWSTKT